MGETGDLSPAGRERRESKPRPRQGIWLAQKSETDAGWAVKAGLARAERTEGLGLSRPVPELAWQAECMGHHWCVSSRALPFFSVSGKWVFFYLEK